MPENSGKAARLWGVNVLSFILFVLVAVSGLINWLLLPAGFQAGRSSLPALRHFNRAIHEWSAVLFLICIGIHLVLHWGYIRANLKRSGWLKS